MTEIRARSGRRVRRGRCRARSAFVRAARGRDIHDVHPNGQRDLAPEGAAVNLLRFVETGPDRAGEIAVVTGEKRVGEIVGRPRFAGGRNFLQAKLGPRRFACAGLERVDQTRMYFVSGLGFNHVLPVVLPLRVPDEAAVFLFDSFPNVRRGGTPAAVGKNRISERKLGQTDLAAAEEGCGIGTQSRANTGRTTQL